MTSGGSTPPSSIPDPVSGTSSGPSEESFPYFRVYVRDNNNGVILFPGADQLANLDGYVDLLAQVSGATVSSYSWNTTESAPTPTSIIGDEHLPAHVRVGNGKPRLARDRLGDALGHRHEQPDRDLHLRFLGADRRPAPGGSGGSSNATWPTLDRSRARSCSRHRHFPASRHTPRSTRPAAPSTPRSTCPATTRMWHPSH